MRHRRTVTLVYRLNVWLRTHPWLVDLVLIALVTVLPGSWFIPGIGRPGWVQVLVYAATVLPMPEPAPVTTATFIGASSQLCRAGATVAAVRDAGCAETAW